jgi:hypothetical protein
MYIEGSFPALKLARLIWRMPGMSMGSALEAMPVAGNAGRDLPLAKGIASVRPFVLDALSIVR